MIAKYSRPTSLLSLLFLALLPAWAFSQDSYNPGDEISHPLTAGGNGPLMLVVPQGRFAFGGGKIDQSPDQLVIEIKTPFAISETEITAGMYRHFLTQTKSHRLRKFAITQDDLPVYGISWDEAEAYVSWLSHQTGHHYRLPSSSEWEYAARAGTTTTYSWGDDVGEGRANCLDCKVPWQGNPAPVKSFAPNNWNIYDMHGNVWEWTRDCVDSNSQPPRNGMPQLFGNCDSRELRGGSARSDSWSIRASARAFSQRKGQSGDVGLRVVLDLPN